MSEDYEQPKFAEPELPISTDKKFAFSSDVYVDGKNLSSFKSVTTDLGVKLPFPVNDSTKVVAGVEAQVSVFNISKGAALQTSVLPMVKFTQELGPNAKVTARISPSRYEYANIGVSFAF